MALALKSSQVDMSGLDLVVRSIQSGATAGTQGFHSNTFPILNGVAPRSLTGTTITLGAADILAGLIVNNNAGAVTLTTDTAANIITALNTATASNANVGDVYACTIINGGNTAGVITCNAGTGCTFDTNAVAADRAIAINTSKQLYFRLTNVTAGAEAITLYI